MNKWARPFEWNSETARPAGGSPAPERHRQHFYFAFLSYSHKDAADADWLHHELERFRVPSSLAGRLTAHGVIPKRLTPIFRDRHELAAADDLGEEIREALESSRCLIVLCSPAAAKSKWTNAEIELFKKLHPDGCIIAAIVSGEPFASDVKGRELDECLPLALRRKYDRRGRPTSRRAEPLAADLREGFGGRRLGLLKIVAGMLGVGLDDLVQREQLRRQRRLAGITAGSFVGMLVAGGLALTAIQARDSARDQRREAESLVEFMIGDLKDKLQPIGRLDVLDGVGSRVLQYYGQQDMAQLSDQGLAQRSKALTLMGQIARDRGDLDRAHSLYRAAYQGTAEAIRRDPEDPQRLFEHAQNAFYIGEIADRRAKLDEGEAAFREYKRLADRMVALEPDSIKYRMEIQYAAANLGNVLYSKRNFREAVQQFESALTTILALAAADPANVDYMTGVADTLALLAEAQEANGGLREAVNTRMRHVALLESLISKSGAAARFRLVPGRRELARLLTAQGDRDRARAVYLAAIREGERLTDIEPENMRWRESLMGANLGFARLLLEQGEIAGAAAKLGSDCRAYERFVTRQPGFALRRVALRDCLLLRAEVAMRSGDADTAVRSASRALVIARSVSTNDPVDASFGVARALRTLGDIHSQVGDSAKARAAWYQALSAIPAGVAQKPSEMAEHAILLKRAGRIAEATERETRLAAMGYEH